MSSGIADFGALKILQPGFGMPLVPYEFFTTTPGVQRSLTFTLPQKLAGGGVIYVIGCAGGGGGGWGMSSGGGGSGGSAGQMAFMHPVHIPAGLGGVDLLIGNGASAGLIGGQTAIKINDTYLLDLKGGLGGGSASSTAGAAGGASPLYVLAGGTGGNTGNGGAGGNWNTQYQLVPGIFDGGAGGGGGGTTATSGGGGSTSLFGWGAGGTGASAGGGGGSTIFTKQGSANIVGFAARSGTAQGQGGNTGAAGYANTVSWGGGGGGGGGGTAAGAGGAGMDGFLILLI